MIWSDNSYGKLKDSQLLSWLAFKATSYYKRDFVDVTKLKVLKQEYFHGFKRAPNEITVSL
jgi:hypothetical protein